ncbi:MAG: signal peptidase II [Candidatus Aegiribacteria sp.]|nr:signal peptidase II [Candidatus Aegiribacteria sp.]
MTITRTRLCGYITAVGILALDQLTKRLALGGLELHHPEAVFGNVLRFTLAWNQGAAFSMPWGGPLFLTVVTAAAAVMVSIFIWKLGEHSPLFLAGLGAILGGALGNLLDRFMYGKVVDFIDIGGSGWRWPTFNVADIAITVGGVILVILYRKESAAEDALKEDTNGSD